MSTSDDPRDDMARVLSAQDAEALLAGHPDSDELPASAAPLAHFLSSLRDPTVSPPPAAERAEHEAVARIAAEIRNNGAADERRSRVARFERPRRLSARTAVALLAATIASGTAVAAAATGSLPGPVQKAVANALSHVDITVPTHHHHAGAGSSGTKVAVHGHAGSAPLGTTGPDAGSSARRGLCNASLHAGGQQAGSVARANLAKAAAAAGMSVTEYCSGTQRTGTGTTEPPVGTKVRHRGTTPTTAPPHGPPSSTPNNGKGHPTHTPPTKPSTPGNGKGKGKGTGNGNKPPSPPGLDNKKGKGKG